MHIGLMTHVEEEVVFRGVEDVVHGDLQLHHAKVGPKMPAGTGQNGNEFLADFRRQLFKFWERQSFYVRWGVMVSRMRDMAVSPIGKLTATIVDENASATLRRRYGALRAL